MNITPSRYRHGTTANAIRPTSCTLPSSQAPSAALPARLLHARQVALVRLHPERKLVKRVSTFDVKSGNSGDKGLTHPGHLEVPENTAALSTHDAPVPDLRGAGVGVHLRQLQLGFGAHARRQGRVADEVSEGLPVRR